MRKKKILIIIPSLGVGGAENVLINFLNLIDYERYDVDLCVVLKKGIYFESVPKQVNVFVIYKNRYLEKMARLVYSKLYSVIPYKLFGRKISGSYDYGLCFLDSEATEFLHYNNATIRKKATLVQSSYKSWDLISKRMKGKYIKQMIRRYKKLDTIISVAEDSRREFEELFGSFEDHRVIYSPIFTDKVRTKADEIPSILFDVNKINFIAVGRLIEVKGYDLLIEAANKLIKTTRNFHVYIAGLGPLESDLKNLVKSYGLGDNISVLGFVDNVYPLVKQADVYIMPSRSEGLPTALCEAMILGKPVIANNVSGCKEAIQYGKYGLMPEPNPESIAESMYEVISNAELRRKLSILSNERAFVYDDKTVMKKYYELFDS